ncbi:MAG: shikimate dehydrogenase [Ginsengibacter sp.]
MKIYGLLGNPLGHSFSQRYFAEKFQRENIVDCSYVNFEAPDLHLKIEALKSDPNLCGLNVTIPYKTQILSHLDIASLTCQEIGACNCIKVFKEKWTGFNTDITGFEKTFLPKLKSYHSKALILGTGGSSKAVVYVLKKLGIEYLFISRKKNASLNIIGYNDLTLDILSEYKIVINTTPLGMFPDINNSPVIPYEFVSAEHYFFDLIYNPELTLFLAQAKNKGAAIENGKNMLSIQAEESWRIWNDENL